MIRIIPQKELHSVRFTYVTYDTNDNEHKNFGRAVVSDVMQDEFARQLDY